MIRGLTLLFAAQWLGEVTTRLLQLPIPGAVLGMLLLMLLLRAAPGLIDDAESAGDPLVSHLSLFFIPPLIAALFLVGLSASEWMRLLLAITLSTLGALVATALTLKWALARWPGR